MGVRAGRVLRGHLLPLGVVVVVALATVAAVSAASPSGSRPRTGPVAGLQLLYRPPVLVRSGQSVGIPVDVICATRRGAVCPATATISVGDRPSRTRVRAPARPNLRFDLTRAARAAGSVSYRIGAAAGDRARSIPGPGQGPALRFYVAPDIPSVSVPAIPFGEVRRGTVALYLPWGSGPGQAGLAPGVEADTQGPASYDVDRNGRVLFADPVLGKLSLYAGAKLVRETRLPLAIDSDVAFGTGGDAFVASSPSSGGRRSVVWAIDASGKPTAAAPVGYADDTLSELRAADDDPYVHLLPEDAWIPGTSSGPATTGRPVAGGEELLKVVDGHSVRLGTVVAGEVTNPVELTFRPNVGELALAEPDGADGYWAVVHLWTDSPAPADQYQVVHVGADLAVTTFAVSNESYAGSMPLSKFRLGQDGALYALQSSADGVRIVRYDIGGAR